MPAFPTERWCSTYPLSNKSVNGLFAGSGKVAKSSTVQLQLRIDILLCTEWPESTCFWPQVRLLLARHRTQVVQTVGTSLGLRHLCLPPVPLNRDTVNWLTPTETLGVGCSIFLKKNIDIDIDNINNLPQFSSTSPKETDGFEMVGTAASPTLEGRRFGAGLKARRVSPSFGGWSFCRSSCWIGPLENKKLQVRLTGQQFRVHPFDVKGVTDRVFPKTFEHTWCHLWNLNCVSQNERFFWGETWCTCATCVNTGIASSPMILNGAPWEMHPNSRNSEVFLPSAILECEGFWKSVCGFVNRVQNHVESRCCLQIFWALSFC